MKKIFTFIVIFIVLVLLVGSVWWFFTKDTTTTTDGITQPTPRTFNPFGFFDDTPTPTLAPTTTAPGTSDTIQTTGKREFFTKISEKSVAGSTFTSVTQGTSTDIFVRYVERETGHIFDYSVITGLTNRISNTTIPRVREALWGNNASMVALRYLVDGDTIETFLGTIASSTTSSTNESLLTGSFLPKNIVTLTINQTLPRVFYVTRTDAGGTGYTFDGSTTKLTFSHPFFQWHTQWSGPSSVLMVTAPTQKVTGSAFLLNSSTGALQSVASSTIALTGLSNPDGSLVALGAVGKDGMGIFIYNPENKQTLPLYVGTLPEKCAWYKTAILYCAIPNGAHANLPDAWYQGVVSFSDTLLKIDATTGDAEYLFDPGTYIQGGADMTQLVISPDGNFLSFINKKDSTLWSVDFSARPTTN